MDDTDHRAFFTRRLAEHAATSSTLNQMAALAANLLRAGSAQVSLISEVQTVVGGVGVSEAAVGQESPAADSLCTVTVSTAAPLVVPDAPRDDRVAHLPPVRSGTVGSYLGVPLVVRGHLVGALCVFDADPRTWDDAEVALLEQLAVPVVAELQYTSLVSDYDSERLLWQVAVDAAGVGAFDWNLATGDLRWDDKLLDLFGLTRATFGGTIEAFNASVHPDDLDRVSDALAAAIACCGTYEAEYRVVLPDGDVRWVSARGRALPGPDGQATRVLGAAFDTTAVQDGEARVARVLEAMPTAFFHLDPEWRFTYVNAEGLRLLGEIGAPIVGSVIWEIFPDAVGSEFETHYRRAADAGEPVEFEAYYPPPLDRWYEVRGWPTPDGLSVYFIDISTRREAEEAALRALQRTTMLSSITEALTGTLDVEEAAAQVARLVVGPLACWSIVTLTDHTATGTGEAAHRAWRRGLRDVAAWHGDPEMRDLLERFRVLRMNALTSSSFLARTLEHERPVVVVDGATEAISSVLEPGEARELALQLAPAAVVVTPLRARGRTVGLLSAFRSAERGPFSEEDVADLADAAARAALALDNARLYSEQVDLAAELQHSLMTAPPEPDHLHVVVRYLPAAAAAQVGGDWYDSFLQPDGATNVVIGDVVGHNTAAAAAMGQVRGLLRGIAVTTGDGPAAVLQRVDAALQTLQIDTTATAVVARFEQTPEEHEVGVTRFRWSNAGHPPPLLVLPAAEDGSVEVLALWPPHRTELLLGLDPDFARTDTVREIPRGSTVVLYTDGLVERRGQYLDEGVERLRGVVAELTAAGTPLDDLCDALLTRLVPEGPEDDVAIVAVRLHPEDRPRPPEAGPEAVPPTVKKGPR